MLETVVVADASQNSNSGHARPDRKSCAIIVAIARTHTSRLIDVTLLCPQCPVSDQTPHRCKNDAMGHWLTSRIGGHICIRAAPLYGCGRIACRSIAIA